MLRYTECFVFVKDTERQRPNAERYNKVNLVSPEETFI